MTPALFRLLLSDGTHRLARGAVETGPAELLAAELTIAELLRGGAQSLAAAAGKGDGGEAVPPSARVVAPIDRQEVWAAGVTYERSREARVEESIERSVYDRVYEADRPELFFKSQGWRVRGPGEAVAVRGDSEWNVPEPELALVVTSGLEICGYTLGNDVSSRSIEGENPLYLPQAKVYDGSCSLGPALVPADAIEPPFEIRLVVTRDGAAIIDERTSTGRIRRTFGDLVAHLGRALTLPDGAFLLTGTGIVPAAPFTLRSGDVVRIEAAPLGVLENHVDIVGRAGAQAESTGQVAASR